MADVIRIAAPDYGGRELLIADRTYYVRTDGNDSNNGLANDSSNAFLTLQKAADVVNNDLDLQGYKVTVQVADGTYAPSIYGEATMRFENVTTGDVLVLGNAGAPENVIVGSQYYGGNFEVINCKNVEFNGFRLREYNAFDASSYSIQALSYSYVGIRNIRVAGTDATNDFRPFYILRAVDHSTIDSLSGSTVEFGDHVNNVSTTFSAERYSFIDTPFVEVDASVTWDSTWVSANQHSRVVGGIGVSLGAGASITGDRFSSTANSSVIGTPNGFGLQALPGDSPGRMDGTSTYDGKKLEEITNALTITTAHSYLSNEPESAAGTQVFTNNTSSLDVTLPGNPGAGKLPTLTKYIIVNSSSSTFDIVVKNFSPATTVSTVSPGGQAAVVWSPGTSDWVAI